MCAAFCSLSSCLLDIFQGVWSALSTLIPLGNMTYCLVTPVTPVSVHLCAVHLCKCTCSICPTSILMREGFPAGPVVKNLPCNAEDTGSIPGPGRSHMPRSNLAHVPQLLSQCSRAHQPQLLSLRTGATEAFTPTACALQQEKPPQ